MPYHARTITALLGLALASSSLAQSYTRDDVARLLQDCNRQRAEHIAPLKQEEMKRCVEERGRDHAWCENDLEYFGEATGSNPGLFWDLPACELSFDVERYFQRYPGKDSYEP